MMITDLSTHSSAKQDKKIQELLHQKDYKNAKELLEQKIFIEPKNADHHYLLGVVTYFMGSIKETIKNFQNCLSIDPKHTDAAICLSVLYNDLGKYEDAKKIFDKANHSVTHTSPGDSLGVDRKFAGKHLEIADLYFRYRRYDEAIEEYTKAYALDPKSIEVRIKRAKALAKKGLQSRAIQELQQLKAEHPKEITPRLQLALYHYSNGNLLDAELEWESVLKIDPSHEEAKTYLRNVRENRILGKI